MTILMKIHVITARPGLRTRVRRVSGGRLPDRLDVDNDADAGLLFKLGLGPDRLFSAPGGEL